MSQLSPPDITQSSSLGQNVGGQTRVVGRCADNLVSLWENGSPSKTLDLKTVLEEHDGNVNTAYFDHRLAGSCLVQQIQMGFCGIARTCHIQGLPRA